MHNTQKRLDRPTLLIERIFGGGVALVAGVIFLACSMFFGTIAVGLMNRFALDRSFLDGVTGVWGHVPFALVFGVLVIAIYKVGRIAFGR